MGLNCTIQKLLTITWIPYRDCVCGDITSSKISNGWIQRVHICLWPNWNRKTFTMEGDLKNQVVNYRALKELFKGSTDRMPTNRYEFSVSMFEVYNEKIRDLLYENSADLPAKKLDIK